MSNIKINNLPFLGISQSSSNNKPINVSQNPKDAFDENIDFINGIMKKEGNNSNINWVKYINNK